MAVTRYSSFDRTVNTIADRNSILNKVNHMTVLVKDAIADPAAGTGKATYRWDASDETWVLVSSGSYGTIQFATEELLITNGLVQLANYPLDNQIWGMQILKNNQIYAEPRLSDLLLTGTFLSGLIDYEGFSVRLTYAYGSMVQQVDAILNTKIGIFRQSSEPLSPMIGDFWLRTTDNKLFQYKCVDFNNNINLWMEN